MIQNKKYVFDLDNTLIFTDSLNNEAYNYALLKFGYKKSLTEKRTTRIFVKNLISDDILLEELIREKQEYFLKNINKTCINKELLCILKKYDKESIALWTSASKERVGALLDYYDIGKYFKLVVFSKKNDVLEDVNKFCEAFSCEKEDLIFFEDDTNVSCKLRTIHVAVITINLENVTIDEN